MGSALLWLLTTEVVSGFLSSSDDLEKVDKTENENSLLWRQVEAVKSYVLPSERVAFIANQVPIARLRNMVAQQQYLLLNGKPVSGIEEPKLLEQGIPVTSGVPVTAATFSSLFKRYIHTPVQTNIERLRLHSNLLQDSIDLQKRRHFRSWEDFSQAWIPGSGKHDNMESKFAEIEKLVGGFEKAKKDAHGFEPSYPLYKNALKAMDEFHDECVNDGGCPTEEPEISKDLGVNERSLLNAYKRRAKAMGSPEAVAYFKIKGMQAQKESADLRIAQLQAVIEKAELVKDTFDSFSDVAKSHAALSLNDPALGLILELEDYLAKIDQLKTIDSDILNDFKEFLVEKSDLWRPKLAKARAKYDKLEAAAPGLARHDDGDAGGSAGVKPRGRQTAPAPPVHQAPVPPAPIPPAPIPPAPVPQTPAPVPAPKQPAPAANPRSKKQPVTGSSPTEDEDEDADESDAEEKKEDTKKTAKGKKPKGKKATKPKKMSTVAMAAIVVASVLGVGVLGYAGYYMYRRKTISL